MKRGKLRIQVYSTLSIFMVGKEENGQVADEKVGKEGLFEVGNQNIMLMERIQWRGKIW